MTTLREHLEAILMVPRPCKGSVPEWNDAARAVTEHVVAAIDLLDNADPLEHLSGADIPTMLRHQTPGDTWRLVHDPERDA